MVVKIPKKILCESTRLSLDFWRNIIQAEIWRVAETSMNNSKGKLRAGGKSPLQATAETGEGLHERPYKRLGRWFDDGGKAKDGNSTKSENLVI